MRDGTRELLARNAVTDSLRILLIEDDPATSCTPSPRRSGGHARGRSGPGALYALGLLVLLVLLVRVEHLVLRAVGVMLAAPVVRWMSWSIAQG
jgi:hypothetical protein